MSDTPDPAALASTVNRDALDGKVTVIGDDADETRGKEFNDAQKPVRRSRQDGVLRRGVGGRKCAERVDRVRVSASRQKRNRSEPFSCVCVIGAEQRARDSPGHAIDAVSPTLVAIEDGNHAQLGADGNFCAPALTDKISC